MLKLSAIVGYVDDLVTILDRSQSSIQVFPKDFANALFSYCAFHVKLNLNHKFKNPDLIPLFKCCSKTYKRRIEQVHGWFDWDRSFDWDIGKEKWSIYHFPINIYVIMTTNVLESFSNIMKAANELPITMLAKYYYRKLKQWFVEHRKLYFKWRDRFLTKYS